MALSARHRQLLPHQNSVCCRYFENCNNDFNFGACFIRQDQRHVGSLAYIITTDQKALGGICVIVHTHSELTYLASNKWKGLIDHIILHGFPYTSYYQLNYYSNCSVKWWLSAATAEIWLYKLDDIKAVFLWPRVVPAVISQMVNIFLFKYVHGDTKRHFIIAHKRRFNDQWNCCTLLLLLLLTDAAAAWLQQTVPQT